MKRVHVLASHLQQQQQQQQQENAAEQRLEEETKWDEDGRGLKLEHVQASGAVSSSIDALVDERQLLPVPSKTQGIIDKAEFDFPGPDVLRKIPGLHTSGGRDSREALKEVLRYTQLGKNIVHDQSTALTYGDNGYGSNIVVPALDIVSRKLVNLVVINDPRDAQRIARFHVQKSRLYGGGFLGEGVLSTRNLELWKQQRAHVTESFLPLSSLRKICPGSVDRARFSVETKLPKQLKQQSENNVYNGGVVNINEFFLFEAMAQLQCVLMGVDPDFMEAHNQKLRKCFDTLFEGLAFHAREEVISAFKFVKWHSDEILKQGINAQGCPRFAAPTDAIMRGCPVRSPLSARLTDAYGDDQARLDNQTTFSFAGFDTTANKMTWFVLEMARHPEFQERLHKEIDQVHHALHGRDLTYDDLDKLPEMTAFLRETLRLWPSVPNGTFRELMRDDDIHGLNNESISLPRGTQVKIPVWMLHHNPELWDNPWEFNPDREWLPEEKWWSKTFSAQTPESYRYAPFTFTGRECIGKNFAHMEARVILYHLFRDYEISLAEPTASIVGNDPKRFPFELIRNYGTLGPADGLHCSLKPRYPQPQA